MFGINGQTLFLATLVTLEDFQHINKLILYVTDIHTQIQMQTKLTLF